jgi:hypothetical protein
MADQGHVGGAVVGSQAHQVIVNTLRDTVCIL